MSATTVQTNNIINDRIRSKPGYNAEVTISADGIIRNEVREYTKVYRDGTIFPHIEHEFNAPYDVVADLLNGMSNSTRSQYMSNSWFEVAIEGRDLRSTASDMTVLDQFDRLASLCPRVQKLTVKVAIPTIDWKIMTKEEYKVSSARRFLLRVVGELRSFTSLKRMEVVITLPEGYCSNYRLLISYILPFYALDTFTSWKLKFQVHGGGIPRLADIAFVRTVDEKHAEVHGEERRAAKDEKNRKNAAQKEIDKAVYIRSSDDPIPHKVSRKHTSHTSTASKNTSPKNNSTKNTPSKNAPSKNGKSGLSEKPCKYPHCKNARCQSPHCKKTTGN